MKKEINYEHLEPFYGTPHIDPFSKNELRQEIEDLLEVLLKIDFKNKVEISLYEFNFKKLLRLFEIIQYSKDKYPFLVSLDFNTKEAKKGNYHLFEVHVWKDPHYKNSGGMSSAYQGDILSIASLFDIKKDPQIFTSTVRSLITRGVQNEERYATRICFGGTKDTGLVIGIPKKDFFIDKVPVFSIHRPIAS